MKRLILIFVFIFLFLYFSLSSFSAFIIDGNDTGVEWDGASVYRLFNGESNCGVNLGLVKFKFDYENDALCMCFFSLDPELTPDNLNAGISLSVDGSAPFVVTANDVILSENIPPYSFDGAVYLDNNNGLTCEVRVGIKSGLPEKLECCVRFIDSSGFYSNNYWFTVENEAYSTTDAQIISPTADNTDPVFNSDNSGKTENTKKQSDNKKKSTTKSHFEIKTSPPCTYTGRIKTTKPKAQKNTTVKLTKAEKTKNETVKVIYYEKEVIVSEVYVSETTDFVSQQIITEAQPTETTEQNIKITLSEGTKYKKIITAVCLCSFVALACFGTYSAKKNSKKSDE